MPRVRMATRAKRRVRVARSGYELDELTVKQEAFAQAYVETGNASEAYRRAYNTKTDNADSLHRAAHAVLKNVQVASRVEALRNGARERHRETVDDLLSELEEARSLGLAWPKQVGASVAATVAKAKLLGLEAPTKVAVEHSGVMRVPVSTAADFENFAAEQQAALQRVVRDGDEAEQARAEDGAGK